MASLPRLLTLMLCSSLFACTSSQVLKSVDEVRNTDMPIVVHTSDSLQIYYDQGAYALTGSADSVMITGAGVLQYRRGQYVQRPYAEPVQWSNVRRAETYERHPLASIAVTIAMVVGLAAISWIAGFRYGG